MPCKWNLKRNDTNELTEEKETHSLREELTVTGENGAGRDS